MSIKKISTMLVTFSVMVSMLSCCTFSPKVVGNISEPEQTVQAFFDCLCDGRYSEINNYLYNQKLSIDNLTVDDDFNSLLLRELRKSYSYEIVGNCDVSGLNATCKVKFTCLDFSLMVDDLRAETTKIGTHYINMQDPDYTNNNDSTCTLNDFGAKYAALLALKEITRKPEKYYSSKIYNIRLSYSNKAWRIILDDDLFNAVSGYYVGD